MTSPSRILMTQTRSLLPRTTHLQQLTKWKLSLWVACTGASGYLMASPVLSAEFFYSCSGIYLCSSAAHVFNQMIERRTDGMMARTRNRPLVRRKVSTVTASAIGVTSAAAGASLLHLTSGTLAAPLALANIALYSGVYTPLKKTSEWNTHVGSIVGAIPPLIGYVASGGTLLHPDPWMLFGIMYVWQLPHFYSLAWLHRRDYINAGLRMFGIKDGSGITTMSCCLKWVTILSSLPLAYSYAGIISPRLAIYTLVPNLFINYKCLSYLRDPNVKNIRSFFKHSLWHVLTLVGLTSYCVAAERKENEDNNFDA